MPEPVRVSGEQLTRLVAHGRIYLLDTVPSTNDYALAFADKRERVLVIARHQTRGRGRFRRHWFSDEDSLLFSQLIFPDLAVLAPGSITQLAGLALCRAIEELTGLKPAIRWPNDVLCQERKLAGILCEARRDAVVVGVGVNLNQPAFPENLPEAGSLRMALGRPVDGLQLLEGFLAGLARDLELAQKSGVGTLLPGVKARSAVLHRRVEVRTMLRRHVGTVIDLDVEGRIVLRTDSGRLAVLNAGQVRRLR